MCVCVCVKGGGGGAAYVTPLFFLPTPRFVPVIRSLETLEEETQHA